MRLRDVLIGLAALVLSGSSAFGGLPMGTPVPMAGTLGPWGLALAAGGYCAYLVITKLRGRK